MTLLARKYTQLVVGTLDLISEEFDRLYWNKYQKQMNSPFDNSGGIYSNDTFTVRAYNWDDNEEGTPNFNYKNIFHVYWYKYLGRCINVYYDETYDFDINFLADMVNDCIEAMRKDFGEKEE